MAPWQVRSQQSPKLSGAKASEAALQQLPVRAELATNSAMRTQAPSPPQHTHTPSSAGRLSCRSSSLVRMSSPTATSPSKCSNSCEGLLVAGSDLQHNMREAVAAHLNILLQCVFIPMPSCVLCATPAHTLWITLPTAVLPKPDPKTLNALVPNPDAAVCMQSTHHMCFNSQDGCLLYTNATHLEHQAMAAARTAAASATASLGCVSSTAASAAWRSSCSQASTVEASFDTQNHPG